MEDGAAGRRFQQVEVANRAPIQPVRDEPPRVRRPPDHRRSLLVPARRGDLAAALIVDGISVELLTVVGQSPFRARFDGSDPEVVVPGERHPVAIR